MYVHKYLKIKEVVIYYEIYNNNYKKNIFKRITKTNG
jgi:hypothetical protein